MARQRGVSRITFYVLRFTFHVSRFTFHVPHHATLRSFRRLIRSCPPRPPAGRSGRARRIVIGSAVLHSCGAVAFQTRTRTHPGRRTTSFAPPCAGRERLVRN